MRVFLSISNLTHHMKNILTTFVTSHNLQWPFLLALPFQFKTYSWFDLHCAHWGVQLDQLQPWFLTYIVSSTQCLIYVSLIPCQIKWTIILISDFVSGDDHAFLDFTRNCHYRCSIQHKQLSVSGVSINSASNRCYSFVPVSLSFHSQIQISWIFTVIVR